MHRSLERVVGLLEVHLGGRYTRDEHCEGVAAQGVLEQARQLAVPVGRDDDTCVDAKTKPRVQLHRDIQTDSGLWAQLG